MGPDDRTPGPFVPLAAAPDRRQADALVRLLEHRGVLAWVDEDHPTWRADGSHPRWVLVPSDLLSRGRKVLVEHSTAARSSPRGRSSDPASSPSGGDARPNAQALPVQTRPRETPVSQPHPSPDPESPDPGSSDATRLSGRVRAATVAGAVALGGLGQVAVDGTWGAGTAADWFGARFPLEGVGVYRFATAGLIHASWGHALGNAVFGAVLGFVLLGSHGFGATAAVWVAATVFGTAVEAWASPGALVLGASAGNYGLVGLWAGTQLRRPADVLPHRKRLRVIGLLLLLVPGALTPFTASGARVAVWAHLVGFGLGAWIGWLLQARAERPGAPEGSRTGWRLPRFTPSRR